MTTAERVVCDDCVTEAYDNGIMSYDEQVSVMLEIGGELPDHICVLIEDPEGCKLYNIKCDCGCSRMR